jgi:hypothetical protein
MFQALLVGNGLVPLRLAPIPISGATDELSGRAEFGLCIDTRLKNPNTVKKQAASAKQKIARRKRTIDFIWGYLFSCAVPEKKRITRILAV